MITVWVILVLFGISHIFFSDNTEYMFWLILSVNAIGLEILSRLDEVKSNTE